jgi:hypothetical protein
MERWISCHGVWLRGEIRGVAVERGPALRQLVLRDQDVGPARVEVDAHPVARPEQREPPPAAASGEALRMEGVPEVPD